ncbi:MAG: hypothetical protein NC548_25630 [Lachnospiraceae bacterium]|nr:hypothetical protein [Lachnospiraceae bacterium]
MTGFTIEAKPGTVLLIGKQEDGSDATKIKIGETGRYNLSPIENMVRYIRLEDSAFAVIDYKCITS